MKSLISPHLQQYAKPILSLVPYADNEKLDYLIRRLLPPNSAGQHLSVKNEIKKLAQQYKKPIDLRLIFSDSQAYQHNNITHYLDVFAIELFKQKIAESNGIYTLAIYHEVIEDAQLRAQEERTKNPIEQTEFKIDKAEPKPLVNKNRIEQEEKKYSSSCRVFVNPIMGMTRHGKMEVGMFASIEKMNNRKVVIQTNTEIKNVKGNKLYLWLYDHHQAIDFKEELELGFVILESQRSAINNKYDYLLQYSSPLTEKQMRVLFAHYLRQKKHAIIGPTDRFITPLFDSITSKGYEQLYINKTHDIPLLCYQSDGCWQAKVAMKTSGNGELWSFFSDENNHFNLSILLTNSLVQHLLNQRQTIEGYAFVLKYLYQGELHYGLIWYQDYLQDLSVRTIFNRYFKNHYFCVIKLSSSFVDAEKDAYVPSALPCHVHPKMAVLNRPTPKAAQDVICDCDHLLTVSDITSMYETIYQPINSEATEFDSLLPERFQLKASPAQQPVEIVTVEDDDSRSEDRFKLCFDMAITRVKTGPTHIPGKTRNISTQGLLVELAMATKFTAGEEIEISLTVPFAEHERTVKKQKYIVLGYDHAGAVRLLINSLESKHLACRAIRKYLFQQHDLLEASGSQGSSIYGLQKAVRNIYAHNHFSIPFYLKATKHQQYINAASFSGNSELKHLVYKNDESEQIILNLLSNRSFRDSCLSIIAVLREKELNSRAFYILVLPKDKEDDDNYSFWYRDISVLKKSNELKSYTQRLTKLGKPAVLKVELKQSNKSTNMYYRDEVDYLKTLDRELAHQLEVQLESTIGIGEVVDLSDIALEMIYKS